MAEGMSKMSKLELLATMRARYRGSSKEDKSRIDKSRILDEFIAVTGC